MLPDLPAELHLHIITFLDPESCLHLALTSHSYHKLSEVALKEHGRLFDRYKIIDADETDVFYSSTNPYVIWNTLKEVLKNPSIGWYVRELNLPATRRYHRDPRSSDALTEEDQAIFIKATRALGRSYPTHSGLSNELVGTLNPSHSWEDFSVELEDSIAAGLDDAIVAILIHHLPYLRTIRITDESLTSLQYMLQWIAMSYSNPVQTHKLPLQQLKNASLAHWDSEGSCEVDWACLFLSIPSVQRFAANAMGRAPYTLGVEIYQANRCSNVTELWLDHCGLELDGLVTLLRGINDLRKLRYTHGGSMVSEYPYEPKRIIQAIEDTVGHSLEELTLEQDLYFRDNDEDLDRISMRGFQRLRRLKCEWHMLLPVQTEDSDIDEPLESGFHHEDEDSDVERFLSGFDIRSILPESLEELRIEGYFSPEAWDKVREMFREDSTSTPNLNKIWVGWRSKADHGVRTDMAFGEEPDSDDENDPSAKMLLGHGYP